MDLNETTVLKEINQDLNGEFLSTRKNNSNNTSFSPESQKENNNKFNNNSDKSFEQENLDFTDFEDKAVDNSKNVNVCEISNNESKTLEEFVSEDKYLVRHPVNDTTLAGYSSDEETFAECNSYTTSDPTDNLTSTVSELNETVVEKSSKLSLTNLNFENLKIDDHEDLDKTTNVILDDSKSEEEEEEGYIVDENELNEIFTSMPDQNNKPIEFKEFGVHENENGSNENVNGNFEFASDSSLYKDRLGETKSITSSESTMGKQAQEKDSGIFLENFVQNSLSVEFKVPDTPTIAKLTINHRWCPLNLVDSVQDNMVPGNEFNFDAAAFDIFDNKNELGKIPQRENSLLLRFDPLLNRPVPVQLGVQTVLSIAEEGQADEIETIPSCSEAGNLSNITLKSEKAEVVQSPSYEKQEDAEHTELNDNLSELQIRSLQTYDIEVIEVDEESKTDKFEPIKPKTPELKQNKRSADCALCVSEKLHSEHETMSVHIGKDLKTVNEDDPVIETLNLQQNIKQEYKMAEIEKKFKNQGIKSEDNDRKLKEFESREEALIKRISEKEKVIAKMNSVIEAYETTISEFISEKAQITQRYEKKCVNLQESSQLNASHLLSLEDTFSDLHTKYERSKQMAINFKQNEEKLVSEKNQLNDLLATQEARYEKMKSHAMSQLQVANDKLENLSKNHAQEVSKLKALLKKEEIARTALAEQLQQKIRENEELVKICEELIGGGNVASENS